MWLRVRTLGELQILTRASYVMIVFVPILAGIWPAVRVGINRYNSAVTESKYALDVASQRLEHLASTMANHGDFSPEIAENITNLNQQIGIIVEDYSLKTRDRTGLPSVWAFAFLASLAVAIAHTIYQAFAPPLIKRQTSREYVNEEVRQYLESPTEGRLRHAKLCISMCGDSGTGSGEADDTINKRDEVVAPRWARIADSMQNDEKKREEMSLIERGAIVEYRVRANEGPFAATFSCTLYLIGLTLIGWIIANQTINVILATWGG